MATPRKESVVKNELGKFLLDHGLKDGIGDIDEIVLSYVISILEDLGDDKNAEENIDVDQFVEMMEAYIPGFSTIDSVIIFEWMFDLSTKISENMEKDQDETDKVYNSSIVEQNHNTQNQRDIPMKSGSCSVELNGNQMEDNEGADDDIILLLEMFPHTCTMEITHCLGLCKGNTESAAQLILERQDQGIDIKQAKDKKQSSPKKRLALLDDKDLKQKMIARYAYQDTEEDKKTFTPLAPKAEPKKMIRYLDGRIVSTKGEKFTEIKKENDEDLKKTYINLKPARKYRFH